MDSVTYALCKTYVDNKIGESRSYGPFPPEFKTNTTFQQFVASILDFEGARAGCAWLGEVEFSGLPTGIGNAECIVTMMTDGIVLLQISSCDTYPFHYEYNSAAYDYKWKKFLCLPENLPSDFYSSTYTVKFVNGVVTYVKG